MTDGLTGLYNRSEIEGQIRRALSEDGSSLSLLMLDLDDFKKVNDVHGHQEGDQVIIALADAMRKVTGDTDASLGRWGGEEFMILLPHSAMGDATALAEKLRETFAGISFPVSGGQTVSIGAAQAKAGEAADALFSRVDKALYTAKANGKNRVVVLE